MSEVDSVLFEGVVLQRRLVLRHKASPVKGQRLPCGQTGLGLSVLRISSVSTCNRKADVAIPRLRAHIGLLAKLAPQRRRVALLIVVRFATFIIHQTLGK